MAERKAAPQGMPGRVIWVLVLVVAVQSLYPLSYGTGRLGEALYQLFYAALLAAGILVARDRPIMVRSLVVLGVLWIIAGWTYTLNPTAYWALLLGYGVLIVFQATVLYVLLLYVLQTDRITRDVLYAAAAVYMLLGAVFVPVYGIIESITYSASAGELHAFSDAASGVGEVLPWQTLVYYSYATLTTLGYGDILPVSMWARSAASLEAVAGVLYTTIIIARLVGLYTTDEMEAHGE